MFLDLVTVFQRTCQILQRDPHEFSWSLSFIETRQPSALIYCITTLGEKHLSNKNMAPRYLEKRELINRLEAISAVLSFWSQEKRCHWRSKNRNQPQIWPEEKYVTLSP